MSIFKRIQAVFMEKGKEKDLSGYRFNLLVGVSILWAFTFALVLPALFFFATSLVPENFFYCHVDYGTPWWLCDIWMFIPTLSKIVFFLALFFFLPFWGFMCLVESTTFTFLKNSPFIRAILGFHLLLCPFSAVGLLMQSAIILSFCAIALFTLIGAVFPSVFEEYEKFMMVAIAFFIPTLALSDIYPLTLLQINDGYAIEWIIGLVATLLIGYIWIKVPEKSRKMSFALRIASSLFFYIVFAIGFVLLTIVKVLGSGDEMY